MMDNVELAAFLAARCGYLTASRMRIAMSFKKNGEPTAERNALMKGLIAERLTGYTVNNFVSDAMRHGIEFEDEAAGCFMNLTGRDLRPSRIYEHPTILWFSCTPDRELDDGLVEIKCPTSATFVDWVLADVVPEEHVPQMVAQLIITGKPWCGFLAYDNRIKEPKQRLFMKKFVPTQDQRDAVEQAAIKFLDELDELFHRFVTAKEAA